MSTNNSLEDIRSNLRSTQKRKGRQGFSIRTKIAFWSGLFLTLVSLSLIGYSVVTLRQASIVNSEKEAAAIAEAKSASVKNQLEVPLIVARTLARSLNATKDAGIPITLSRQQVNAILRKVLIQNPSFLGTYTLWEPNEFDGLDADFVGAVAHDSTGRFIPYWVRGDDGIIHTEALTQYETPGAGDWYILPRSNKRETVIAPIFRRIQGQDVVIASFIIPIVQNGKFYGIAGVDAPIGFVQQLVDDINLYDGTTNAVLFTDTGKLVAVRQKPELIDQPASVIYPDFDEIRPQLDSPFTRLSPDGKYLQIFSPIDIGESGTHWVMGLIIPFEKITAPATSAAIRQVIISTALIVIALIILWLLAGQIVRPLQVLTNAAASLSQGDWTVSPDIRSGDETEVLANAFNLMVSQIQTVLSTLEHRVAERTQALAIVAEVGVATATVLESEKLLQEVVDLTKERFNLYQSLIYLVDETGENMVLTAAGGETGHAIVAKEDSIPIDHEKSVIARAARERRGVIVSDATREANFMSDPRMPETRSELAVPLIAGGNLLGVFDIQSDQVGRFTEADISVQTTLAAQVSTSIQNVRSFEQSKSQAQLESLVNIVSQKIQRTTSVEETLQTAIQEVSTALGGARVSAKIRKTKENEFTN